MADPGDTMSRLDPQLRGILEQLASVVPAPDSLPEVEMRRAALDAVFTRFRGPRHVAAADHQVPGPRGPVPVRAYRPSDSPRGVVVWLHGGAWIAGGIASHDGISRVLADRSGAAVINVDYRLAPEHPFPAGLEDAAAALDWVGDHRDDLDGGDGPLVVGGDSAGATFTAVLALMAVPTRRWPIDHQLLVYPATDLHWSSGSWHEFGGGEYGLSRAEVDWTLERYRAPVTDWRASPILAESLAGVAPATIVTAELDPLRDEAEAYGRRLVEAGVTTTMRRWAGMVHGFVGLDGLDASEAVLDGLAATVRNLAGARTEAPAG